jgi:hypothetical protein
MGKNASIGGGTHIERSAGGGERERERERVGEKKRK